MAVGVVVTGAGVGTVAGGVDTVAGGVDTVAGGVAPPVDGGTEFEPVLPWWCRPRSDLPEVTAGEPELGLALDTESELVPELAVEPELEFQWRDLPESSSPDSPLAAAVTPVATKATKVIPANKGKKSDRFSECIKRPPLN